MNLGRNRLFLNNQMQQSAEFTRRTDGKTRFALLAPSIILLIVFLHASRISSALGADSQHPYHGAELYYTIQLSTYNFKSAAERLFNQLAGELPSAAREKLRVEYIAPFYAVRLGKFDDHASAAKILAKVRPFMKKAIILEAYYLDERIVTLYGPTKEKKPAVAPVEKPMEKESPIVESPAPAKREPAPRAFTEFSLERDADETFMDRDNVRPSPQSGCLAGGCHGTLAASPFVHKVVQDAGCGACHEQKGEQHPNPGTRDFAFTLEGAALCYQCHEKSGIERTTHEPVKEGECLNCHDAHGSENKFFLSVGQDQKPLCFSCHDQSLASAEHGHGPVELGSCTYCHNPHFSKHNNLLRGPEEALCMSCHVDFQRGLRESAFIHSVIQDRACTACHRPHGSSLPRLLEKDTRTLCYSCHPDVEKADNSRTDHPAMSQGRSCGNCHHVHFSDNSSLLQKEEQEVCFVCHGQDDFNRSRPKPNVRKEILEKKYLHGPVAEKKCSLCHNAHGTDHGHLLTGEYPDSLYLPYRPGAYAFCFQCHDSKMLDASGAGTATRFRNGGTNLHYLHVAREEKGRTCRTCHEPHASDTKALINKEGVPFGNWFIPLGYTAHENGGSCMPGCHQRYEYNRVNPVDYTGKRQGSP